MLLIVKAVSANQPNRAQNCQRERTALLMMNFRKQMENGARFTGLLTTRRAELRERSKFVIRYNFVPTKRLGKPRAAATANVCRYDIVTYRKLTLADQLIIPAQPTAKPALVSRWNARTWQIQCSTSRQHLGGTRDFQWSINYQINCVVQVGAVSF